MMRNVIAVALIAVSLTACSGPAPSGEAPATESASKPAVPRVTDEQSADLMKRISPVTPKLTQEEITSNARSVCAAILQGGSEKALVATVVKHYNRADDPIADAEAAGVVEAIRANGFCVESAAKP